MQFDVNVLTQKAASGFGVLAVSMYILSFFL